MHIQEPLKGMRLKESLGLISHSEIGWWSGASEGRMTVTGRYEEQMFGKQMFVTPCRCVFQYKKLSLIITPFLVQASYLYSFK